MSNCVTITDPVFPASLGVFSLIRFQTLVENVTCILEREREEQRERDIETERKAGV